MKSNNGPQSKPQTTQSKQKAPENKDNLDSRKNEEQDFKGSDVTHNKKATRKDGMKEKDK
jgi:hypothetical protein